MPDTMSEDVMALSGEIDDAITVMNEAENTRGDLVDEKTEETPGEIEETDPATKEVEDVAEEETERAEVGGGVEEVNDEEAEDGRTEDPGETLPPQVSDDTLERAVAAGIPVVDAKALTPESLERVIAARVDAAYEHAFENVIPEAAVPAKEDKPKDLFADLPELDKENYEPAIIAQMERVKEIARTQQAELQEFRDHGEQVAQSANQVADQEMEQWFDKQVGDLGDDFKESLGEGNYRNLSRGSTQFGNRAEIVTQMSVMDTGYRAQGIEPPSRDELFDSAVGLVLRDTYTEIRNKEIQGDLAKQSKQHIRRASGGKAKSQLSDEDAIAAELEKKFG